VFVKYRRGVNLDDAVPQIRRLVASSIPGLQPDKVSVVLVAAAPHAPAGTARARDAEREWLPAALAGVIALTLAGAAFAGWRMTRARAASADESAEAVEPEAAA
jgi:type III secretion protein J